MALMDLTSYLKYCLGYVRMSQTGRSAKSEATAQELGKDRLDLIKLLNADLDGSLSEPINLRLFSALDPKNVTPDQLRSYNEERKIARSLEQLGADSRNYTFTKQLELRFGYFKISLPLNPTIDLEDDAEPEVIEGGPPQGTAPLMRELEFPIFSVQVDIERNKTQFSITPTDPAVEVHINELQDVLAPATYQNLTKTLGEFEANGALNLPISDTTQLLAFWENVRAALALSKAQFDSESFQLERSKLVLSARSNFFLSDDLRKLTLLTPEELEGTALSAWTTDEEMSLAGDGEISDSEIFFPFPYDKYQSRILSLLGNRASVIQGPPGTGKSQSICNLICHLAAQGKTVLFVSQKPQALKVVKDRLKSLDVASLFGYIPSTAPGIINEEDEADGAGPALARVGASAHAATDKPKREPDTASIISQKNQARGALQADIDREREYTKLRIELDEIQAKEIEIANPESFLSRASKEEVETLFYKEKEASKLELQAKKLSLSADFASFDPSFKDLSWENGGIGESLEIIRKDWIAFGPKGECPNKLFLWWSERGSRKRTAAAWAKLPPEIIAYVESLIARQESRAVVSGYIALLRDYALAKEATILADTILGEVEGLKVSLGLSNDNIQEIADELSEGEDLADLVESNKRIIALKAAIAENVGRKADQGALIETIKKTTQKRSLSMAMCLGNRLQNRIAQAFRSGMKTRGILAQFGKAFNKAKKAFRTFHKLRNEPEQYQAILGVLPVWIMELEAASRLLPLKAGMFDYVIFDEASQCNVAYALPAMFRGKKALFFGDSLQMRDPTAQTKRNQSFADLATTYSVPDYLRIKATEGEIQSVLDIAAQRGIPSVALQFHYRSPAELIGFSNENFYKQNGTPLYPLQHSYTPFQDSGRIMVVHHVDPVQGDGPEISPRQNNAEALYILELVKKIQNDPKLKDLSIGVLSFFADQARLIRQCFEEAGIEVDGQKLKVAIIEGIQGDEKDIIIHSFVIRDPKEKRMYNMLTGETGDLRKDISAGRVNVAFSRARKQSHAVVSMAKEQFPDGIWLKRYLSYAEEYGKPAAIEEKLKPFDSKFEEEFYAIAKSTLGNGFIIRNQVPSCGFKIDFTITSQATGRSLAIECDGPMHFQDEGETIYVESDIERQEVLEKAGWQFIRIRYSDWLEKSQAREDLLRPIQTALLG